MNDIWHYKYLDTGTTRYWVQASVNGIINRTNRWITLASRTTILEPSPTVAKLEVWITWWTYILLMESRSTGVYYDSVFQICRRAGSPLVRTPSPRRRNHLHPHHDIGFSDTVSNVVEIVKEERGHRGYRQNIHSRYPRGMPPQLIPKCHKLHNLSYAQGILNTYIQCFVVWGRYGYGIMLFHNYLRIYVFSITLQCVAKELCIDSFGRAYS